MLRKLFILLLILFATEDCFTQEEKQGSNNGNSPAYAEVVIGIPNLRTQLQLTYLKTSLSSLNGVLWAGYCHDQHYVLIKVDRFISKVFLSIV